MNFNLVIAIGAAATCGASISFAVMLAAFFGGRNFAGSIAAITMIRRMLCLPKVLEGEVE